MKRFFFIIIVLNSIFLFCPIGQEGQEHHDQMMKVLMDGVNNPEDISVKIKSFEHTQEK